MKSLRMIMVALLLLCCWGASAFGATDEYLGDTAIYTGVPSQRPRPNVLFIIDNSQATLNIASGVPYRPLQTDGVTPHIYADAGFDPWTIYAGDNQGNFTVVAVAQADSNDSALSNMVCTANNDFIRKTLLKRGTYSGSGTANFPNLRNGDCDLAPKGSTYALGNYLNYLHSATVSATDTIVSHDFTTLVKYHGHWQEETKSRKFLLTQTHVADADNEPGTGASWTSYWSILSETDSRTATPWASGTSYSLSVAFHGDTQRKIIFDAIETVVGGALSAVDFGAMTYGANNQGGKIVYNMADLSADLSNPDDPYSGSSFGDFLAAIPGVDGSGTLTGEPVLSSATNRPQAEALYDAGSYLDIASYPGTQQSITETAKIPSAIKNPCGYNHIIFITNGLPNTDAGSASSLGAIGDYDQDGWPDESVYGEGSHYLDDVARWLNVNAGVTVHTILAFQAEDDLVHNAAEDGGGNFYNVYDAEGLAAALTKLLANIVGEVDTSFVAPVVPASTTNRTVSSNRVYLGLFKPQSGKPWFGNLKKYMVSTNNTLLSVDGTPATDADGNFIEATKSYWGTDSTGTVIKSAEGDRTTGQGDGGIVAAGGVGGTLLARDLDLSNAATRRKIYTYPTGSSSTDLTNADNAFLPSNAKITASLLNVADDTEKDKLISYVHGFDAYSSTPTAKRNWILGDILHSKPLVFSYGGYLDSQENNCSYNKSVIYVGANDGMLHAFNDCDGSEKWAFIPPDILGSLKS